MRLLPNGERRTLDVPESGLFPSIEVRRVTPHGAKSPRRVPSDPAGAGVAAVDLYWLPLDAGGHFVRLNGRIYEALASRLERRPGV
jgi:hypothetical protein